MFKKKPYVRFVNSVPGVEIVHPIIPASQHRFEWFVNASRDFKQREENNPPNKVLSGVNRCVGIIDYINQGFIVPAPFDFSITTNGDRASFSWETSADTRAFSGGLDYIGSHSPQALAKFMPVRDDSLQTIIKINSFWRINSSDDLVFLQVPIAYPDHNMFTAFHGLIDCRRHLEINVQMQWHKLEGTHLVKAGTPLCQIIPVPRDLAVDLKIEQMTAEDQYVSRAYKYLIRHNYKKNINRWRTSVRKILNLLN